MFLYLYLATRNHKYSPTTRAQPESTFDRFAPVLTTISPPPTLSRRNQPGSSSMKTLERQRHLHKFPHRIPTLHPLKPPRQPRKHIPNLAPDKLLRRTMARPAAERHEVPDGPQRGLALEVEAVGVGAEEVGALV